MTHTCNTKNVKNVSHGTFFEMSAVSTCLLFLQHSIRLFERNHLLQPFTRQEPAKSRAKQLANEINYLLHQAGTSKEQSKTACK